MSINAPEWPFMVIGCIAAIVQGGVQPVFAIIFSTIIGVSYHLVTGFKKTDWFLRSFVFRLQIQG
jgi:hypothetical protein